MSKVRRVFIIMLALCLFTIPALSYARGIVNENVEIEPNGPIKLTSYYHKERVPLYGASTINSRLWRKIYVSKDGHEEGYYEGYIYLKRKDGKVWAYFEGTLYYTGKSFMDKIVETE